MDLNNYYNEKEIEQLIGIKPSVLKGSYKRNIFFKTLTEKDKVYYVSKQEIDNLQKEIEEYENLDGLLFDEVAKELDIKKDTMYKYLYEKKFPNAIKTKLYSSKWKIPRIDIDNYKKQLLEARDNSLKIDISNYYTTKELTQKFNMNAPALLKNLFEVIDINDIVAIGRTYYFPKEIIATIKPCDIYDTPDKNASIEDRWSFYEPKYLRINIKNTVNLYKKFYFIKISSCNYSDIFWYCQRLLVDGLRFLEKLDKEIYDYNDTEMINIVSLNSNESFIKNSIAFINYVRTVTRNCNYKEKYNYTSKIKEQTDKEIYTKSDFKNMYLYVKDIDLHIKRALEDASYAESWFYIAMHFINAWRSMDIIEFPYSNLNMVKPLDKETLLTNKLTIVEAQEIINFIKEQNKLDINKNGVLNKFLTNESMLTTIATAILILEYHYKDSNTKILLPLFKEKGVKSKTLSIFLGDDFTYINFSNRISNRTLLSYFQYNVTNSSKNGDIANVLSTRMRGHKDKDTLRQYVMNVNEDDFFDDISYHLFNRGHFGWLFNSLLEISISTKTKELTIDEKTLIIEKYQKFYTPQSIESITSFLLKQQNEYKSIALEIASIPNSEILERFSSIFAGYMPSKEESGQCLYSKACKKPYNECKNCPYLIPKIYMLYSLKTDIEAIISNLNDIEEYRIPERIKLTTILFKLMSLLNQSVVEFGKEYVSTFINLDNLKISLSEINTKLLVPDRKE